MLRLFCTLTALALTLAQPLPAGAACQGENLFDALPPAPRASIRAATDATPFAHGLIWQARRGAQQVTLVGTYHFDDPRHAALLERLSPALAQAKRLLVEAGPQEEAALKADMARHPELVVAASGPTLPERLPPAEWRALAQAMKDRGMPPFLAAKMRPWYVTMLLALPPCAIADQERLVAGGLDHRLIRAALSRNLPVQALEPYDTVFRLFDAMPQDQQLAMIRAALATEAQAEDYARTLADSYFAGDARLIWDLSRHLALSAPGADPQAVAADFAAMEQALMVDRNRAWIPVIEAAADQGPVLVAFGALHLSGAQGVLALLQARGFTVTALP